MLDLPFNVTVTVTEMLLAAPVFDDTLTVPLEVLTENPVALPEKVLLSMVVFVAVLPEVKVLV